MVLTSTLILVIEWLYVLVVSAATKGPWPGYMGYYDLLAEGFRAGHLYLVLEPPPQLLAQANPFDVKYAEYWLGDASLYHGHFYLYWGPLPALLLAAVKSLLRIRSSVGDQYLVFSAFSVCAVATTGLLSEVRRRLFPRLPYPLFAVSVLACALGNPVPHLMASSSIYQAAISAAQASLVTGLYFAFSAVVSDAKSAPPALWRLLAAGAAWAGALACRVSLAPAVALLVIITAVLAEEKVAGRMRWSRVIRNGGGLALPVVLGCGGLLLYNKLRFDSWFEAGVSVQLTTWIFRFSPRYFLANIHQYLFRLPELSCHFPYAIVPYEVKMAEVLPGWIPFREGYMTPEPVAGMAWAFPMVWLTPVPVLLASPGVRQVLGGRQRELWSDHQASWHRAFLWCAASFAVLSSMTILAPLGLYMATMRYLGDVRSGVALLGTLGMWTLFARTSRPWQRRLAIGLCTLIAVGSIVLGLLLGYQGYTGHFERFNPTLSATLVRVLSLCH